MARDRASRDGAKPLRLFVAIEIPDDVRAAVEAAVALVHEEHPRARWVPRANQHVTLKFLGATWPRLVDWVIEAVEGVADAAAPFDTRVEDVGAFPNERRARVLWAGLEDGRGRVAALCGYDRLASFDAAITRTLKTVNAATPSSSRPRSSSPRSSAPWCSPASTTTRRPWRS
jgi:2'-5' RNA ligase